MLKPPVLTHHHPAFLKVAYSLDLNLIDHERHIPGGRKYLTWEPDRGWRVWRMTRERVPIPLGRFDDPGMALFHAR